MRGVEGVSTTSYTWLTLSLWTKKKKKKNNNNKKKKKEKIEKGGKGEEKERKIGEKRRYRQGEERGKLK